MPPRIKLTPEQRRERKALSGMRSGLRRLWMWYGPARKEAHKKAKVSGGWRCAICAGTFKAKDTAVDHIVPCGAMRCWDDLMLFFTRLMVGVEGLRVLCDVCHASVTEFQRKARKEAENGA